MKVRKTLLMVVLTGLLCGALWGQEGKVDSLEDRSQELERVQGLAKRHLYQNLDSSIYYAKRWIKIGEDSRSGRDIVRGKICLAHAFNYKAAYDSALVVIDPAIELSYKLSDKELQAEALNMKGNIVQNQQRYDEATELYEEVLQLSIEVKDTLMIGISYQNKGISHDYKGAYDEAIMNYLEAIKYFKALDSRQHLAQVYSNIAIVYYFMKQKEKSVKYYDKAILLNREADNYRGLCIVFENKSALYQEHGELNLAEASSDSALFYSRYLKDTSRIAMNLYRRGGIASIKGENESSLKYYRSGLRFAQFTEDTYLVTAGKINIGKLMSKIGRYEESYSYLKDAQNYAIEIGSLEMQESLLPDLIRVASRLGKQDSLLAYFDRFEMVSDTLFNQEKIKSINELETKYQTEQKELRNQALQSKNELKSKGLAVLSLLLIALAGLSLFLYRQRQRIQAQKSEIELLNREQRHRMMNNLVFANSLMSLQVNRLKEQPEAQQAVREADARLRAMSALHRRLHHDGEGQRSVEIRGYLEEVTDALQRSFGSPEQPLHINLHAPDAERVDGEAAMRIGLIVNELATNSCKHAFNGQPDPQINVELKPEAEGRYRLIYTDNGSGLPADFQVDTKQSMGLFLIHNLVKQLNGRIAFSGDEGTRVECELDLKAA